MKKVSDCEVGMGEIIVARSPATLTCLGLGSCVVLIIYDEVENPTNLAMSTHINITADLRYYAKIRIHPVFIEYSRGLNHFSNALIKAPNLGINVKNNDIKRYRTIIETLGLRR